MQRKILRKVFAMLGVPRERVLVTGNGPDEILAFAALVVDHVRAHPGDKSVVIADENLEFCEKDCRADRRTVSGSLLVDRIRKDLATTRHDAALLTLVRSANDSSEDVKVFLDRAHAFMPKLPLNEEKTAAFFKPLWEARFGGRASRACAAAAAAAAAGGVRPPPQLNSASTTTWSVAGLRDDAPAALPAVVEPSLEAHGPPAKKSPRAERP